MTDSKSIHVLLLNASDRAFGAEKSLAYLMNLLRDKPIRFTLLAPGGSTEDLFRSMGCEEVRPFPFRILRKSKNPLAILRQTLWFLWANLRMIRILRSIGPDVVHVNGMQAMMTVLLASKVLKSPVIWHVRDLDRPRRLARICAGTASALIVASQTVREQCEEITGEPLHEPNGGKGKIYLVPNPIFPLDADLPLQKEIVVRNAFDEANPAASEEKTFRIGLVGQMIPRKGQDILLKALPEILKNVPYAKVYFYGDDPLHSDSPYIRTLRQMADESNVIRRRVHFEGYCENPAEIYGNLDAVAIPSRSEAFGRVALEAMRFGLPVIAARTGGLADIVEAGVSGLFFTRCDSRDLAQCVIELSTNLALQRKLAQGGRAAYENYRSEAEEGASQIATLYANLCRRD